MKIIEEVILKDTVEYISRFEAKHGTLKNIYQNVGELNLFSLQDMNYQFDKSFFDDFHNYNLLIILWIVFSHLGRTPVP